MSRRRLHSGPQSPLVQVLAPMVVTIALLAPHRPGPGAGTIPAADSTPDRLLAVADSAWDAQRYDVAAETYLRIWEMQTAGEARDRAGVMSARAMLELGKQDDARALLEEVAGGETRGHWWGLSVYHLGRLAPTFAYGKSRDSLTMARKRDEGTARLRSSAAHFAARAEHDSAWQQSLIDAQCELLARLDTIEELDRQLAKALDDAATHEQEAALHMAYVEGLGRIRPRQFLPVLRQKDMARIRERRIRSLELVTRKLPPNSHVPAALDALAQQYSLVDPKQRLALLEELASDFPNTTEGAQAKNMLGPERRPTQITIGAPEAVSTADSVRLHLRGTGAGEIDLKIWRMDDERAIEWWGRGERREIDPIAQAVLVRTVRLRERPWSFIDTTLALRLAAGSYVCLTDVNASGGMTAFRVTDHRLLSHAQGDSVVVTAISRTAEPVPGVEVDVYEAVPFDRWTYGAFELVPIGSVKTGKNGRAAIEASPGPDYDGESPRNLFLVSRLGRHSDIAWQPLGRSFRFLQGALWTDRTVYCPGEEVAFQVVCIQDPARGWWRSTVDTVRVRVGMRTVDTRSHASWDTTLTTNEIGGASGAFVIPLEAADGSIYIEATKPYPDGSGQGLARAHPKIQAFDRPDWDFRVELRDPEVTLGDTLQVDVQAQTAPGAPLAGARITVTASTVTMWRRYDHHEEPPSQGWYGAGPRARKESLRRGADDPIGTFAATLDTSGRASIRVPGIPPPETRVIHYVPYERRVPGVILEVSIDDGAGRHQSRWLEVPIYPGRAWCSLPNDGMLEVDTRIRDGVTVRRIGNDNRPVVGPVHYRWVRRVPDLAHDRYVETVADSGTAMTEGNAFVHLDTPPGNRDELVLDVWADPEAGAVTRVGKPPDRDLNAVDIPRDFHEDVPPRHWIAVDRLQYSLGDTARVLLSPALRQLPGLLSTGASREAYPLPAGTDSIVSIPIRPEFLPDVFVYWDPVFKADRSRMRREGTTKDRIVVEPSSRLLSLAIETDQERYAPGDAIEVTVRASDSAGRPVSALITLGAVDEAIYAIAEDDFDIARAMHRLSRDSNMIACGMGTGINEPPDPPVRVALRPTAFWKPALVTDPTTGIAKVRTTLPHDIANWRITARAVDREGRVGQARGSFVTESALAVRPRLPRFARVGDQFAFGVWVDNHAAEPLDCEISWQSAGLVSTSKSRVSLVAGPESPAQAVFEAVAEKAGVDSVSIVTQGGRLRDAMRLPLPILEAGADVVRERSAEEFRYSLRMLLERVRSTLADTPNDFCGWREDALRLALSLETGRRLLAAAEQDPAAAGEDIPMAVLQGSHRLLEHHQRLVFERHSGEGAIQQALAVARFLGDLAYAERLGWEVGEAHARARLRDWLSEVATNASLSSEERVEVVAELVEMGVAADAAVEMAMAKHDALSPGARAVLARAVRRSHPKASADLLASAIGYARVSEDSAFAHYQLWPLYRSDWRMSPIRTASEVLLSIASAGDQHPLAQPLANAIVVDRASGNWPRHDDTADAVRALVAFADLLAAHEGGQALERMTVAEPSLLSLERRVSVAGDSERAAEAQPDTVFCAIGDTIEVNLTVRALAPLRGVELHDPTPAGCSGALALPAASSWSGNMTVRDSHVRIEPHSGELAPGEKVLTHHLLVERHGLFHVPASRVVLSNLPELWAESAPLVVSVTTER